MLSIRSIAIFIAIFAFIFTYLHATPLPYLSSVGDKAVATLAQLNGTVTFLQFSDTLVTYGGMFNQGINFNDPDHYDLNFGGVGNTFSHYNITTNPPIAGPWSFTGIGDVGILLGRNFSVLYNLLIIDSAIIVKATSSQK
ncbi:hypothetical protein C2G38_2167252 [Gigaspora rosea]|uniref:Uncharacterized protein n=1 Tax=Gigaspora rosea TaxID=44941 RepID=A0A397VY60_9GLOM|nr:hypothetical protein C2G38_2167252 [Gigaspora rosea]CAG8465831.1 25239_t:CDS:1 [Gigaspora rosea]